MTTVAWLAPIAVPDSETGTISMKLLGITALAFTTLLLSSACGDDSEAEPKLEDDSADDEDDSADDADDGADDDDADDDDADDQPAYSFASNLVEGESSVSYGGQVWRHVALLDLNATIEGLTDAVERNALQPDEGVVIAELDFFLKFDPDNGNNHFLLSTDPEPAQSSYDDLSVEKDLISKLAGNDDATDHKDWDGGDFLGWGGAESPQALVVEWFEALEQNARDHADAPRKLNGIDLPVHVSDGGLDYQQLVQKFLTGAVAFSQGTDDYLDDATDGKGLLSENIQDGDEPFTLLEHAWDEAFGYFGAARDYDAYSDDEIAAADGRDDWQGYHDSNDDGEIDLKSEFNFGHSVNAAKRDRGSAETAPTDFTRDAFEAFVAGRQIISDAEGELSDAELDELREQRDAAVEAWEKSISATVVHYINDTLKDMATFGTDDYDFLAHAKHWGELKGFALVLQFNPRSPLNEDDLFSQLHEHLGTAPVLESADEDDIEAYKRALLDARELLGKAYDFDDDNLGDEDGENGW